ncbi:cyclic nucleotide-binding domain-containing protein [Legionella fallonii]|nr:cyclic nucleotide-binding domain-containing protein [Legionella fallonii]
MINTIPIFSGIGIHEQNMLARKCLIVEFNTGVILIKQGEIADRLYAILKGSVDVIKTTSNRSVRISRLGAGDVFGEIAILRAIPRTASIITTMPCKFISINGKDFLEIYQYFSPKARDNIQLMVEKRLAQHR